MKRLKARTNWHHGSSRNVRLRRQPSASLAMDSPALRPADRLDLGQEFLVGTADREDHTLASLDLFRGGDAEPIVRDTDLHQQLDSQVPEPNWEKRRPREASSRPL